MDTYYALQRAVSAEHSTLATNAEAAAAQDAVRPYMRTSFHHQPEALHSAFPNRNSQSGTLVALDLKASWSPTIPLLMSAGNGGNMPFETDSLFFDGRF